MRYLFPADLTLDEVRGVIARHNERTGGNAFIEADRGDHRIFNYVVSFDGAFPAPNTGDVALDREYAILRECRGLTFHVDGRLLNRKFNKFFNVNEKPETQMGLIDWSQPHRILEKLDGSMITPLWTGSMDDIDADKLRWATKMGMTDVAKPVEEFVAKNPHYARWVVGLMLSGWTPLFEWCSRQQKIVIDYAKDDLVLLAVRNNRTGEYLPYEEMLKAQASGIPVVRALDGSVENIEQFMAEAHDLEGSEGYVIRFDDGHMVKVKGAWYVQIHKTKDLLQHEKDVLKLITEDRLDDAKAFMDEGDRERVERYYAALVEAVNQKANDLLVVGDGLVLGDMTKKDFVGKVREIETADQEQGILFRLFDSGVLNRDDKSIGREVAAGQIWQILAKHVSTGPRVESVRHLIGGLNWRDYQDRNTAIGDD